MTNYRAFNNRIRNSNTLDDLAHLESSLKRLWDNGIFTENEFKRLDSHICDKVSLLKGY